MKYDFIILYEHRGREMENAVFLAMLLEKKGYKVAIEYRRSARLLFQKADVLLVPFFYNNENVIDFSVLPFTTNKKIINLQYEQVFSIEDEVGGLFYPHESAIEACHIVWGEQGKRLLLKNQVREDRIFPIGHASIDLNSNKYDSIYYSKEELAKKFNLPLDKKWHLYISSFSHVEISDEELAQSSAEKDYDFSEYLSISRKTQKEMLVWFERILEEQSDTIIVYRPHPAEIKSKALLEMKKKVKNFYCISDYSIRQWIRVSDSISTWFSTSIVDVFFAHKPCLILRPVEIPQYMDYRIYRKQHVIKEYEEFAYCIINNKQIDIEAADIQQYYCNTSDADTFEKLTNICSLIRKNDEYAVDYRKYVKSSGEKPIKYHIYRMLMGFASLVNLVSITPPSYRYDVKHTYIESKRYKKEIKMYRQKFSEIVNLSK